VNTDLEVPGFPQHKGRVKKSAAESNTVEFQYFLDQNLPISSSSSLSLSPPSPKMKNKK
jgi:hypothetical protein